jgi:hypothetical protein
VSSSVLAAAVKFVFKPASGNLKFIAMKKIFVSISVLLFLGADAQDWKQFYRGTPFSYEIGIGFGGMNAKTDLGRDVNYSLTRFSTSVFGTVQWEEKIGLRFEATFGSIEGKDENKPYTRSLKRLRNLSFKTNITELALLAELQPVNWKAYNGLLPDLAPYLVGGIGLFHFSPTTKLNDAIVDLPKLHLDGQGFPEYPDRKPYKLTQLCFPLGFGGKFDPRHDLSLRVEFLYRLLLTDYIDDVSKARTDVTLYSKYLPAADAALAEKLYIRRWEVEPGEYKQTGPRGNPGHDGYFTVSVKLSWCINRDWLW